MTDLHLVVGGLLTRDPLLAGLLLNHAVASQWAEAPAASALVPSWAADDRPGAPAGSELFTVEVSVTRDTPRPHRYLDTVLGTVHAVLTSGPLDAERLADAEVPDIGAGTVSRAVTWALTPAAAGVLGRPAADSRSPGAASSSR